MKSSRKQLLIAAVLLAGVTALRASLPDWIQNIEAKSLLEGAIFRAMQLPGVSVWYRRPPAESHQELTALIAKDPKNAELYSLRAMEAEQKLDATAAEADWRQYVDLATDKAQAQLTLADFYHRRLRPQDEIAALMAVAKAPANPAEELYGLPQQRSWQAFERMLAIQRAQAIPKIQFDSLYNAWIERYPRETSLYPRYFEYLLAEKDFEGALRLLGKYKKVFPDQLEFPVKAQALLNYRQGSIEQGLGVYEKAFEPLWSAELVQSYFELMRETRTTRQFLEKARADLAANPDDLKAAAQIFYYYQQQGRIDAALQVLADFRQKKEARKAEWTAQELYTLARLGDGIHAYPESARYYYALHNVSDKSMPDAPARALSGLTQILLTASEQNLRVGAGELSLYKDIGTMDPGPGFLNGILSLVLNSTNPEYRYSEQERRAIPYFHRARASELLAMLDQRYPGYPQRAELHVLLLETYARYGEDSAVIREGQSFLAAFPRSEERTHVALTMADAYARKQDKQSELAIYDSVLLELGAKAQNVPLGKYVAFRSWDQNSESGDGQTPGYNNMRMDTADQTGAAGCEECEGDSQASGMQGQPAARAFSVGATGPASEREGARSQEYEQVLNRYLSRLAANKQIPQALVVLRKELERNPNDPGLYERLAAFLEQNQFGAETEAIYRRAVAQFKDNNWYHKLARWYLRSKRSAEYERLSREVMDTFSGSDIERYFNAVGYGDSKDNPGVYIRFNEYARQRFPHDLAFVRNLLNAYRARCNGCYPLEWVALIEQHWYEDNDLRSRYFEYLSVNGLLERKIAGLAPSTNSETAWRSAAKENAASADLVSQAEIWRSHFEAAAAPLGALAQMYPADGEKGRRASEVYRSLAYFDPENTGRAARVEINLLAYEPGDRDIIARIGDIYSDRELFDQAARYWEKMPHVEAGNPDGYLQAATIYWDYFKFDDALRLITAARAKSGQPAIYAYEAGAIYEAKRDFDSAITEYVRSAVAGNGSGQARLLQLAHRSSLKARVEAATEKLTDGPDPEMEFVQLRVQVLEAQQRQDAIKDLLSTLVERTNSLDTLESLERIAEQRQLDTVKQRSLERQAQLSADPIRRLELRYALVQFYESRKLLDAAQRNIEALYRENPKIMGVVRSTVDFYWRNKMQQRAIDVLLAAAKSAYPSLRTDFTFEAARKATEARQFDLAKGLLDGLLKTSPQDGRYLAAMADVYAQSGDDRGLRAFYLRSIDQLKSAPGLSRDDLNARIATLRRGLIPALTRLKDHAGAIDQYIELINKYPDDEGLVSEAAIYADQYQRKPQLIDFYIKTVAASPKDFRWAMVLARIYANVEDFPAAIEAYAKAIQVRPDRNDLRTARATLLERLSRFDEAVSEYEKLYELNYRDQQWMIKIAETRVRQGKTDLAVQAIHTALVEPKPQDPKSYFEAGRRLVDWRLLGPAQHLYEKGVQLTGSELLADSSYEHPLRNYAQLLVRVRQLEAAVALLEKARAQAIENVPRDEVVALRLGGFQGDAMKYMRDRRAGNARAIYNAVMRDIGTAVDMYYTPEEKVEFARMWSQHPTVDLNEVRDLLIPVAEAAVLPELEVKWRMQLLTASPNDAFGGSLDRLAEIQKLRGQFDESGRQIEALAASRPRDSLAYYLGRAAEAYQDGGNRSAELRVRRRLSPNERLYELLLAQAPAELTRYGFAGADYAIAHGTGDLALQSVSANGMNRSALWNRAYTSLVGLYFADPRPVVYSAFEAELGNLVIGDRLGKPIDRTQTLAGDTWYYYSGRYGEYLGRVLKQPIAEDFLPAMLERSPGVADHYATLGEYYADAGDLVRSIKEYEHALELAPGTVASRDRYAVMLHRQNRIADAVTQWRIAYQQLLKQATSRNVPEAFWQDFVTVTDHITTRKLLGEVRADVELVVAGYVKKSGEYRVHSLLRAVYIALPPTERTSWLLAMAEQAPVPQQLLSSLINAKWVPEAQREPLFLRMIEFKRSEIDKAEGISKQYAREDLRNWQFLWLRHLVRMKDYTHAQGVLDEITADAEPGLWNQQVVPAELLIAAQTGSGVQSLLERYANALHPPAAETLRAAAKQLEDGGNRDAAQKVMEFVYTQAIQSRQFNATDFLGLSEIRLEQKKIPDALALLRRMTLVVGVPFSNHAAAAAVLAKHGQHAEAVTFLRELTAANPWDVVQRIELAKAEIAADQNADAACEALVALASSKDESYDLRLAAADALAGSRPQAQLGSGELDMVARHALTTVAEADKPYYYRARMLAASAAPDSTKVTLLRNALRDRPRRPDARVPLFRAALGFKRLEFALSILQPYMAGYSGVEAPQEGQSEEEGADSYAGSRLATLSRAERPVVAKEVGLVYAQLGRKQDALEYLRLSLRTDSDAVQKKDTVQKIELLKDDIRRENINANRRPRLSEEIEPGVVVRPRLVARAGQKPAAPKVATPRRPQ